MNFLGKLSRNTDIMLALGVVAILGIMILPLSPWMIDISLGLAIAISIVLLLTSVYVKKALEFSIFPTVLLVTTLFRLALNVATTRSILLRGPEMGTAAGGEIIRAFGEFVVGGNYAVGIVVFIILVIINFVVITKGAGRVAEVAARFTLDAMPGKQMAIDADLNAGVINEEEARRRRREISREADFYGAMDGASKFVRGDAIAGILIVAVNILGGIVVGTLQKGMALTDAAQVFTLLTIGDGLVSQIPALVISTAAGIIVTRTETGNNLGAEVSAQVFGSPKSLLLTAAILSVLGLIPGMPLFPFFFSAAIFGGIGYRLHGKNVKQAQDDAEKAQEQKLRPSQEKLENLLSVDQLELEVGYGLISIVDSDQNGDLLERISNIRKQFAIDLGIIVPSLRIRDNLELKPGDYRVLLKGVQVGNGSLMVGSLLAMDPGNVSLPIQGIPTKEPAFGLDALWVTADQKEDAQIAGYTVVDNSTVIATHLTEIVRSHSHELLGRQELQTLIDTLKEAAPKVVDDLVPGLMTMGAVLKVLKALLKEQVSIRDLRTILESLAEVAPTTKDTLILTETVRGSLARTITKKLINDRNQLVVLTLDKTIEETLAGGIIQTDQGQQLSVDPEFIRKFVGELHQRVRDAAAETPNTVILCSPVIRPHLRNLIERFIQGITVISHSEIGTSVQVKSIGTVRI